MRLVAALTVCLLLFSGCAGKKGADEADAKPVGGPVPLVPLDKYSYRGTACVELGLFVPVSSSNLRPHVPPEYRLVGESQGRAVLAFAFARCDAMAVPGANGTAQVFQVDVSANIEDPSGRPGGTIGYEIALLTTHGVVANNVARAGFPAHDASNSSFMNFALQQADILQGRAKAGAIEIGVDATAARSPAAGPSGGTYVHASENATSRMVYDVSLASFGPAKGIVTAPSGSLVAQLMGASSADATGFFGSFTLGANITRTPK